MKSLAAILLASVFALTGQAQENMVFFQPAPGQNNGSDLGGLSDGKDAWVYEMTGQNYGSSVQIAGSPISTTNTNQYKAYMQFDLSTLPEQVDSVILRVHFEANPCYCNSNCAAPFYFYYVDEPWNEMSLNWNNAPMEGQSFVGPVWLSAPNNYGFVEFDITSAYRNWVNGERSNYGFTIYSPQMGDNNGEVSFRISSSDHWNSSYRPALKVYQSETRDDRNVIVYDRPSTPETQRFADGQDLNQLQVDWTTLMDPQEYLRKMEIQSTDEFTVELKGYPNPMQQNFYLQGVDDATEVRWIDVQGRVFQPYYQPDQDGYQYDTSSLPAGVYMLEIRKGTALRTLRVVKVG